MPVYDLKCSVCQEVFEDEWGSHSEVTRTPCSVCGGEREIVIHPVASHLGATFHTPGEIRQFDMTWTDKNGKTHTRDMRQVAASQPKGRFNHSPDEKGEGIRA